MALDAIHNARGGRRPGAGAKPATIAGILKKLSPEKAERLRRDLERFRRDVERSALQRLVDVARKELAKGE